QTELISNVASTYYELLTLNEGLDILTKNIKLQQRGLQIIEVQKEAGMATELGVQQFRAVLANSRAKEQEVLQQISLMENHLNFLTGRFEGSLSLKENGLEQFISLEALNSGTPLQMI